MSNSYQRIKSHIFNNLKQHTDDLVENTIKDEIESVQKLISAIGLDIFAQFLHDKSKLTELNEQDWLRMKRELETEFDVKMEFGVLIQGDEQRLRDSTWWTGKSKQNGENFYWNRYKSFISKSLPDDVVNTIDIDTDIVMNNLEDPNLKYFNRYGMVVGHVQSGKTANYSALVCKAADSGYKFIVVVAGGMNNLRNQTQQRLNEYFVGQNQGIQTGAGIGNTRREKLPISLTTSEKDFNKQDADRNSQGLNFDNINVPILIVIKKNTRTLTNVITWLEKQYKNKISEHSMLLIDDESDYASINTKEEEDPTTINKKLRELLNLFHKSVYVAYTATPYANIFIDHEVGHEKLGKDLFPKDFIYALEAPTNYFGARKVFLDSNNKYLIPLDVEDYGDILPLSHKKDDPLNTLPESLYDAVRVFILNVAIRHLSGQGDQHNSMMIHASRFTQKHQEIAQLVNTYVEKIKHELTAYGKLPNAVSLSNEINDLKSTFENRYENIEFDWKLILDKLVDVIKLIVIREVHQKKTIPLEYRKGIPTNAIVIGGTSLSRGYTLEGLNVSYFLRKTIFYDTLMQMGRWFGYRTNYDHLCKIYMTKTMIKNFAQIIEATEDLIDDFRRMAKEEMTPEDFGLAVKYHPDSALQVTARNKLKNTQDMYLDMKLDGHAKETAWLDKNPAVKKQNINAIKNIIAKIDKLNDVKYEKIGNKPIGKHLWRNVPKNVIKDFLDEFEVFYTDPFGIKSRMPIDFIKKYVSDVNTLWDVALYSGDSNEYTMSGKTIKKERRVLTDKNEVHEVQNRQISSGSAESIVLSKDEQKLYGSNRKDIRAAMKKPLLMLHILETKEDNALAAFGISFPGGVRSSNNTIKIKVNTVMTQQIEEMLAEEKEADD